MSRFTKQWRIAELVEGIFASKEWYEDWRRPLR
jgi:hypothetical protein